jgi:phosphoribosylaminoimidazole-succinocarboxamide synthase
MQQLSALNIQTHFISQLNMREQMVHCLDMFPFRVVIRNYAAGNMMRKFGFVEGTKLPKPIVEYYIDSYEDTDSENMCLIDKSHIEGMGWATTEEINQIENSAKRTNDFLSGLFSGIKLKLANFSLSFGRHFSYDEEDINIMIGNEISPKTCRLWEDTTENKLKFRYISLLEVAERLKLLPQHAENHTENSKVKTKQDIYKLSDKV